MAVGRLKPVARTSFWKELAFVTVTLSGEELAVLPTASRARAKRTWLPLLAVLVSQDTL